MEKQERTAASIRIVVADDHGIVRHGIVSLLRDMQGIEVVAEARSGEELLAILERTQADVVLSDVNMPGRDGIEVAGIIRERHPEVKVLMLSMYGTVDVVKRAVAKGAHGYVLKDAPPEELEAAVRQVLATGSYFSGVVLRRLLQPSDPAPHEELTPRQLEVLVMIAKGKSAKEIGFELGLSSKTVDVHRLRVMERLGITDIAGLTRYAVRHGLVKL